MGSQPHPSELMYPPLPPSITGWSPPDSPDLPPLYENPPNDFALAAFQTPQQLDRLISALDHHDFQETFGFRLEQGTRLHKITSDTVRTMSGPTDLPRTQSPPRNKADDEIALETQSSIPSATDVKLEDTESDGSATATPAPATGGKKKKRIKKKKKDKGKEMTPPIEIGSEEFKAEKEETSLPVADDIPFELETSETIPDTPRAFTPIIPPPHLIVDIESTQYTPGSPEVLVTDEHEMVSSAEAESSEISSKFVSRIPPIDMPLTPPLSPVTEDSITDSITDPTTDQAIRIEITPPQELILPMPPITVPVPAPPITRPSFPSDTERPPPRIDDPAHPLDTPWTILFSDTSDKGRQARRVTFPVTSAEEYSHGLFTIFTASTLEDLLGGWKALRRRIAASKGRVIEPLGSQIVPGTGGLGFLFMNDDNNLHCFVKGIKPMWEDRMCAKGGKLMLAGTPLQVSMTRLICYCVF